MAGFSNYLAQQTISHFIRRSSVSVPSGTYLALFTADPTDANITANEVVAAWYARQNITGWSVPSGTTTSTSNSNTISFNVVTGSAITLTHWGIYDAANSGNLLCSGAMASPKTLNIDDQFIVDPGELVLDFQ